MTSVTSIRDLIAPSKKELSPNLLRTAKPSFNVRRVDLSQAKFLITEAHPKVGDIVLARIEKIGQHKRIHMSTGRRARLYEGDLVILAYANRYAVDQFEAIIPSNLSRCHMVAAGGVASRMVSCNESMRSPTIIKPLGLLAKDDEQIMNIIDSALPEKKIPAHRQATIITVVGTEMNAGKTTTAANIIRGGIDAGLSVAAAKITGTGAAGDFGEMTDAGADYVYDLVDAGYPSTYKLSDSIIIKTFETLVAHLLETNADILVLEIADGILQDETKFLLSHPVFRKNVDSIVLAACDSLAAKAGADILKEMNLPLVCVSGKVTGSDIGRRAAMETTGCKVFGRKELSCSTIMPHLLPRITQLKESTCLAGDNIVFA